MNDFVIDCIFRTLSILIIADVCPHGARGAVSPSPNEHWWAKARRGDTLWVAAAA
ncbi:hypothetical protein [Bifidobacterium criceti]|uniref:hypothetical protein n=1 Tax=Bifidobacterium criceti TaxID=1960969 RepID=UPI0012FF623A|nr:hypothetical protein [Bifidobacterium criceti]